MLQEAAHQLGSLAERCTFLVHDIFDNRRHFAGGSVDCVASAFAICHAQGDEVYARLYQRMHAWLKPGGYFVCYDHVAGDSASFTALNALGWARLLAQTQNAEQVRAAVVSTYQEDSPLSVRRHLELLTKAGFGTVEVLYKRDIFAIYAAVK